MVMMNLLRMLVDLSFYGAYAGLFARAFGGNGAISGVLIQCVCFGLSRLGGSRRGVRFACLLPMVLCWLLFRHSLVDCIFLIPTAVYIVWLVWRGDYVLDCDRQRLLFSVFWKVLLVVIPFGILLGGFEGLTAVTVPYSVLALVCSVILMRALRHDPKVYCGVRYQAVNLLSVGVAVGAAALLSTRTVLDACAAVLRSVYEWLVRPVLELLLSILLYIIQGVVWLFSALSLRKKEVDPEDIPQIDLSGTEEIFGDDIQIKEPSELLRMFGILLLVAVAVVLLVLFFRWLNRHKGYDGNTAAAQEKREFTDVVQKTARKKETSPVRKIRAQYRAFLKWCVSLNISVERSSTSLDIHRKVSAASEKREPSQQIRELYIRARYAEEADRDDVRKMKQLCEQLKKTES